MRLWKAGLAALKAFNCMPPQGIDAVHVWQFTQIAQGVKVSTEESWSGEVVRANAASLQPLLDGALQEWLTRLKATSEASASRASH